MSYSPFQIWFTVPASRLEEYKRRHEACQSSGNPAVVQNDTFRYCRELIELADRTYFSISPSRLEVVLKCRSDFFVLGFLVLGLNGESQCFRSETVSLSQSGDKSNLKSFVIYRFYLVFFQILIGQYPKESGP